jgi:Flp pilus assembly protein TadD/CRP-like cAMP-binding protein
MVGVFQVDEQDLRGDQEVQDRLQSAQVREAISRQLDRLASSRDLEEADISRLAKQIRTATYSPGEIILPIGARANFWGLLIEGRAALYADQWGAGPQVEVLLPGGTFGDDMLGENHPSDLMLKALTDCEVMFLRSDDVERVSSQRRSLGYQKVLGRLAGLAAMVLLLCLVATLALSLSPVRRFISLAPMGVGQLCSQWDKSNDDSPAFGSCAVQAWTWASYLAPDDARPLLALGAYYYRQGQMELAEQSFEAAKALEPDWAEAHNNLGLVLAAQGDHQRAIEAFQEAWDLEPGTSDIKHNLGLSFQATGETDEAIEHYRQAVAFGDPQPSTLVNMAIGYYETGHSAKAAAAAQQALRYDAASAPAYTVLGAVEIEARQLKLAVEHLKRAVELDDSYSQAHFHLGLAYKALGQPVEAVASLERALATTEDEDMRFEIQLHLAELQGTGE